jgi:hypothetical protein
MRFGKRMKNILQIIGNLRIHVEDGDFVTLFVRGRDERPARPSNFPW